jgi:hypothetical protein
MAKIIFGWMKLLWDTRVIPPKPTPILPLSIEFFFLISHKKEKEKGRKEFYFISKKKSEKRKKKFGFIWG